jgi:hypothetical protein
MPSFAREKEVWQDGLQWTSQPSKMSILPVIGSAPKECWRMPLLLARVVPHY